VNYNGKENVSAIDADLPLTNSFLILPTILANFILGQITRQAGYLKPKAETEVCESMWKLLKPPCSAGIGLIPKGKLFSPRAKATRLQVQDACIGNALANGTPHAFLNGRRSGAQRGISENTSARGLSGCPFAFRKVEHSACLL
jgi:hypothetical protein